MTPLRPGFRRNLGHLPDAAAGKRVEVVLATGAYGRCDGGSTAPPGWAADGRGACRWTLTGSPFDIDQYRVL